MSNPLTPVKLPRFLVPPLVLLLRLDLDEGDGVRPLRRRDTLRDPVLPPLVPRLLRPLPCLRPPPLPPDLGAGLLASASASSVRDILTCGPTLLTLATGRSW